MAGDAGRRAGTRPPHGWPPFPEDDHADSFDVIIVNLPDPQTAQINRFYTLEFFREAAAKLRPGGVFSFRLTSSENYISPELAALLRSIRKTLGAVFPEVAFIPGDTLHLFASNSAGVLVRTADGLLERLRRRGIQTTYVREYYMPFPDGAGSHG